MKSYDEIIDLRRSYKDITPIGGQSRLQAVLVYELARHGDAKMQAVTPFDILKTNKECGFYKPRTVQRGMLHAYSWSMDAPSDAVPHANKALKVLVPLVIPRPPAKGDLDVSEVVLNPFFFS
jgi:DNA-directed RNA polymerase